MENAVEFKAVGGGKIFVDPLKVDTIFDDTFFKRTDTPSGPSTSQKSVVTIACNGFAVMAVDIKVDAARKLIADAQKKARAAIKVQK